MRARRITLFSCLLALAVVLAGCATQKASLADLPVQEYAGHFTSGPGESWFRPCSAAPGDRPWWVTFTERSVAQADEARAAGRLAPGTSYYVRWRAAVTTGGEVGPQGPGVPALLVRELLDLRPAGADDCADKP
jgi:hypothetical protein